jgi:hypothetical protein
VKHRHPSTPPRAVPIALVLGIVLALVLIGLSVVTIRDLAIAQGWAAGTAWIPSLVDSLDGLGSSVGMAVAGGVLALVGVALLLAALKPGSRTHVRAARGGDLWLTPAAVASLAVSSVDRTRGVVSAQASRVTRRGATVQVITHGAGDAEARSAAESGVGGLTPMRITVQSKEMPS